MAEDFERKYGVNDLKDQLSELEGLNHKEITPLFDIMTYNFLNDLSQNQQKYNITDSDLYSKFPPLVNSSWRNVDEKLVIGGNLISIYGSHFDVSSEYSDNTWDMKVDGLTFRGAEKDVTSLLDGFKIFISGQNLDDLIEEVNMKYLFQTA